MYSGYRYMMKTFIVAAAIYLLIAMYLALSYNLAQVHFI